MNRAERLGSDNPCPHRRLRPDGCCNAAWPPARTRFCAPCNAAANVWKPNAKRCSTPLLPMEDAMANLPWTRLEDPDELDAEETENLEEAVVDAATAAQTVAELEFEIAQLDKLVDLARSVSDSGEDRKWTELRRLLLDDKHVLDSDHGPRKLIIFTEHRDTLNYLTQQIRNVPGRADAVVTIHGGTQRGDRRVIREAFTHDPDVSWWPPTPPVKVSTSRLRT